MDDKSESEDDEGFRQIFTSHSLPAQLEERTIDALKKNRLLSGTLGWVQRRTLQVAASLLLAGILFSGGLYVGRQTVTGDVEFPGAQSYMLLLYRPADFIQSPQHVEEYGEWMRSLTSTNTSATGEALQKEQWTFGPSGVEKDDSVQGPAGPLSGFFVIHTDSRESAMAIAASCPHLKYNGVVELRPILKTH